jgi:hypothetical protein
VTRGEHYVQGPGVVLAISGGPIAGGYFRREYGEALAAVPDRRRRPDLDARFGRVAGAQPGPAIEGRHKLARWRVRIAHAPDAGVTLRAQVLGPFGLPLVQSLILEPLIGLAAAQRGPALVPGALVLDGDGRGVLLVGGSGAGKTSLAARAVAAGHDVLADDRVFLDADATASWFARRMRLYPDIRETAPGAWAALGPAARRRLDAVATVRRASAGRFAPPIAVTRRDLGAATAPARATVARILLLRREERASADLAEVAGAAAVDEIAAYIRDDRAGLAGAGLDAALEGLARHDRGVLEAAAGAATVQRLAIPAAWPAARSVQRLAEELGIP